jgi:hypothetical protein
MVSGNYTTPKNHTCEFHFFADFLNFFLIAFQVHQNFQNLVPKISSSLNAHMKIRFIELEEDS